MLRKDAAKYNFARLFVAEGTKRYRRKTCSLDSLTASYDAWGNFTATYHNGASATNLHNPYTYRSYYYDKDLSLYYLSSRYYDSNTGRFINADGQINTGTILGYNLFAYCENNPVMRIDPYGDSFLGAIAVTLGGALVAAAKAAALTSAILLAGKVVVDAIDTTIDAVQNIYNAVESVKSREEEKETVVADTQQYNYWTATIVNDTVVAGTPLTYSEAKQWVATEKNLLCKDRSAAVAIIKFYPSAVHHDAHKGGLQCGYLNHYHLNNGHEHKHKNHIWYYGE